MTTPVVTALIPTYRRPVLLRRAIESVLAQEGADVRVLVSDNASGDDTGPMVRALAQTDPRVVYHCQRENVGAAANFQWCLGAADTSHFALLSDDDVMLPGFVSRAMRALEENADASFFCGQTLLYNEGEGSVSGFPQTGEWRNGYHEARRHVRHMVEKHFVWTGCVFETAVREIAGPFENIPIVDILFLGKAAWHCGFVVDMTPGAIFLETGSNASFTMPLADVRHSYEVMARRFAELPGISSEEQRAIEAALARKRKTFANGALRGALEAGQWSRFREAADFLEAEGALSLSKRWRIAIGRRGGTLAAALSWATRLAARAKRRRRSGMRGLFHGLALDEVVKAHATRALAEAARAPHRSS